VARSGWRIETAAWWRWRRIVRPYVICGEMWRRIRRHQYRGRHAAIGYLYRRRLMAASARIGCGGVMRRAAGVNMWRRYGRYRLAWRNASLAGVAACGASRGITRRAAARYGEIGVRRLAAYRKWRRVGGVAFQYRHVVIAAACGLAAHRPRHRVAAGWTAISACGSCVSAAGAKSTPGGGLAACWRNTYIGDNEAARHRRRPSATAAIVA